MYERQFIHTFREAVRDANIPSAYKLLLFTMSTYSDSDGANVYPSQAVLAQAVCGGERTVRRHLQHLQSAKWLKLVKRGSSGGNGRASRSANVYKLRVGCGFTAGSNGTIIPQDAAQGVKQGPARAPQKSVKVNPKPTPKRAPVPVSAPEEIYLRPGVWTPGLHGDF